MICKQLENRPSFVTLLLWSDGFEHWMNNDNELELNITDSSRQRDWRKRSRCHMRNVENQYSDFLSSSWKWNWRRGEKVANYVQMKVCQTDNNFGEEGKKKIRAAWGSREGTLTIWKEKKIKHFNEASMKFFIIVIIIININSMDQK